MRFKGHWVFSDNCHDVAVSEFEVTAISPFSFPSEIIVFRDDVDQRIILDDGPIVISLRFLQLIQTIYILEIGSEA